MSREILNEADSLFSAASRTISSKTTYKIQIGIPFKTKNVPNRLGVTFPCKLGVIYMMKKIVVFLWSPDLRSSNLS